MNQPQERIKILLEKYTSGKTTEEEERILFEWMELHPEDPLLDEHVDRLLKEEKGKEALGPDQKEDLFRSISQELEIKKKPVFSFKLINRAAAVLLLLILGMGAAYFLFNQKSNPSQSVLVHHVEENDIRPAQSGAVLRAGEEEVKLSQNDTSFVLGGNEVKVDDNGIKVGGAAARMYSLQVPKGGTYKIQLPDGTLVWLNASSQLEYPSVFSGKTREVTLTGEAYFEVAEDPSHPFLVHSDKQNIRVLGTRFNVSAYADDPTTVTTLLQGKVEIHAGGNKLNLAPGQQAVADAGGGVQLNEGANIDEAMAWKNGYFRFQKADIQEIMRSLQRWYDIEVVYEGDFEGKYFGAIMNRDNSISKILGLLEATGNLHFTIDGQRVIVTP